MLACEEVLSPRWQMRGWDCEQCPDEKQLKRIVLVVLFSGHREVWAGAAVGVMTIIN